MKRTLLGLAMIALAGCGGDAVATDSGTPPTDTGTPPTDTGTPLSDTGTPPADTGTPPEDTGTPPADSGVALDCTTYCTLQLATCATMEEQYVDMESCMGSCAAFTPGTLADTDTNTLGCRIYHTMAAASMAGSQHCLHAGPTGYGICGASQCEAFCQIAASACTGANEQWATNDACMADCAMYSGATPGMPVGAPDYSTSETSGNSFACRMYHLTVASSSAANATIHCGHIALISATCGG